MNVLEVINVTREVAWLPWAVQYFFLVGLSVAAFFLSLPGLVFAREHWLRAARLALLVALVTGLAAPIALLADLHQPGRFWHFYVYPNFKSWMAWGAFFIPGYVGGLLLYAWAAMRPALAKSDRPGLLGRVHKIASLGGDRAPRILSIAAGWTALMAALVLLYTGMEVMVVRARPLWHTPFLPLQFVVTAGVGALGAMLLLDRVLGQPDAATERMLNRLLALLLASALAIGAAWLALGLFAIDATHAEALRQVSASLGWRLTAVWAALSAIIPITIIAWKPVGTGWLTGLIAIHAAWMFRWTVFIGGQTIPKTGAGFYTYELPLGYDGWLGILGTGGLLLFLLVAITSWVPWDQAVPQRSIKSVGALVPGRARS